jgi:hypothetical protein
MREAETLAVPGRITAYPSVSLASENVRFWYQVKWEQPTRL